MSLQQDREELRQILKSKSVKTGKFTLASGKESDLYVDCRVTTLDSRGAVLVGRVLHDLLRQEEAKRGLSIGSLGGLTMGADPITLAVAMSSSMAGDATAGAGLCGAQGAERPRPRQAHRGQFHHRTARRRRR
jgi:orotate phosphoribosyltransferase